MKAKWIVCSGEAVRRTEVLEQNVPGSFVVSEDQVMHSVAWSY